MKLLISGLFSKNSGKTTFIQRLISALTKRNISWHYFKPVSGINCWDFPQFVETSLKKGFIVSFDSFKIYSRYVAENVAYELARQTNLTHVVFSRINTSHKKILTALRKNEITLLEEDAGGSIDAIPMFVRYKQRIFVNDWWWKDPNTLYMGKKVFSLLKLLPRSRYELKNAYYLKNFLFWKEKDFLQHLESKKFSDTEVKLIELHDDDVLSALPHLTFDYFIVVAGNISFLTTYYEWKQLIQKKQTKILSIEAIEAFSTVDWILFGEWNQILSFLEEQVAERL